MSWLTEVIGEYNRLAGRPGKAISHRPDLAGRVHIYRGGADEIQAVNLEDYTDYADVYARHVWFRKGV